MKRKAAMNNIPKGYKQTEVGVIPEDWEVKKLGEIGSFSKGKGIRKDEVVSEGLPCIRYGEIYTTHNDYIKSFNSFITQSVANESVEIKKGDLLFAGSGETAEEIGKCVAFVGNERVFAGGDVVILRPSINNNSLFLGFLLNNQIVSRQKASMGQGDAVVHISGKNLSEIQIPLPLTKAEQTAIATALSDADALINSLEKLIAKKRNIKQGAMQQLLTGKKHLPGFSGDWEVKKLGCIGTPYGGLSGKAKKDFDDGKYPYIPFLNIMNNPVIDATYFDYVNLGSDERQNKALKGDLFFNGSSETPEEVGMCSVLQEDIPNLYLNSFCFGFHLNKELRTDGLYLSYYFRSSEGRKLFYSLAQGATRYNLSKSNFLKMEIPYPNTEEQTAIAAILSDMDAEIEVLEQKLDKYRMIKQGMMQELLTGRIRLLDAAADKKPKATVTAIHEKYDSQKKKHNWEFNEAVVISVLTKAFGTQVYPLGRKRYTKLSYLLHRYAERIAEGYLKKAAGPYNPGTKYGGPEKIAQTRGYIKAHSSDKYTGFIADNNIEEAVAYFNKWYGPGTLRWLEQFRYKDNDQLELLTTVDMAVQDLLQNNQEVSIASVKTIVQSHDEWRLKLKRPIFSDDNIDDAIRSSEDLFGY